MKYPKSEKVNSARIQTVDDGYGPIYDRKYTVDLGVHFSVAQTVFDEMKQNIEAFLPNVVATMDETNGSEFTVKTGNRYVIHLLGPWDAPLEVGAVNEKYFEFRTLEGAPEAGVIRYKIENAGTESRFIIHSTARSGKFLLHVMYHFLQVGKFVQRKMWEEVCSKFHERCQEVAGNAKQKAPTVVYSQTVQKDAALGATPTYTKSSK